MATVIYNHREMEYQQKKYWKEKYEGKICCEQSDGKDLFDKSLFDQNFFLQIFQNCEDKKIAEAGCILSEQLAKVVFPEDYAMDYGYDTMRLYVMFEGEPKKGADYEEGPLEGIYKFLNRLMILIHSCASGVENIAHNETKQIKMIEDQEVLEQLSVMDLEFGVKMQEFLIEKNAHMLVATLMEQNTRLSSVFHQQEAAIPRKILEAMLKMLAPFAPFMSEALWRELGNQKSVFEESWPIYDAAKLQAINTEIHVAVQVNGKLKTVLVFEQEPTQEEVIQKAKEELQDRFPEEAERIVFVPGKVLNFIK